jgi:hypothetical protein
VSGGRGTVARWDGGTFESIEERDGRVEVEFDGSRLRGRCVLEDAGDGYWRAAFAG